MMTRRDAQAAATPATGERRRLALLTLVLAVAACARPSAGSAPTAASGQGTASGGEPAAEQRAAARADIAAMMQRSAAAWTRGDLDAFMEDYMPGDATTYVGRRGVLRGPAAIRAAYAPRFAPGAVHDSLSFEALEVDLLAPDAAHALAYYVLSRGDSVTARGPTSLVLRKRDGRWRIVHDHSS